MKKSVRIVAVTAITALTLGSASTAFAHDGRGEMGLGGSQGGPQGGSQGGSQGGPQGGMQMGGPRGGMHRGGPEGANLGLTVILAQLVKAGTITQAQSDLITKALIDAPAAARAAADAAKAAHEKLVADTVGVAWAEIQTRIAAGETLGAIAGAKKDALIAALLKEITDRIEADVAAGRLTPTEATAMKTGLIERITAEVVSVRGGPNAFGPQGKKGKKSEGLGESSLPKSKSPSATTPSTSSANSNGKAGVKQVKSVKVSAKSA